MQSVLTRSQSAIMRPIGHINASNAYSFQEELTAAVEANISILVDLSQVESLDSAGLMALVSALSLAQQSSKRFSLCGVSASIRIIFELTQLDRVFEILEDCSASI